MISRTSVMGYRDTDKNLEKIAKELGVAKVIEGGVQRSGDQIRINIQLIDTNTGFHLWAKSYTREITTPNIFALQNEVTDAIAKELRVQFNSIHETDTNTIPTDNLAALEAYFRGNLSAATTTSEGYRQAINHFQTALELDPRFAEAHAEIANAYLSQIFATGMPVEEQLLKAWPHITRALELNSELSAAYQALGQLNYYRQDPEATSTAYERAIELNPNNARAYQLFAVSKLYQQGDADAALILCQKAAKLDPNNLSEQTTLADVLVSLKRTEEARLILQSLLQQDPQNIKALSALGRLYDHGYYRFDEAIRYYRKAFALDPTNDNLCSAIADAYFDLGDTPAFLQWSKRSLAMAPGSNRATFLKGLAHEFKGEIEQAKASYAALKPSDDYFDWSAYKLASASLAEGRPQAALDSFTNSYPWLADPNCVIDNKNFLQVVEFVYLLYANGQKERSSALANRALSVAPKMKRWGATGYQAFDAPLFIVLGDTESAISTVREFVEGGGALSHLATDAYSAEIHDHPEFVEIIGVMNARLARQKDHLQRMETAGDLAPIPDLERSLGR